MKHYIIVKFKETVDFHKLVKPIEDIFNECLKIEGISGIEVRVSNSKRVNRHDLMIKMELTESALLVYDESEPHKQWKEAYGQLILSKTIFDCD